MSEALKAPKKKADEKAVEESVVYMINCGWMDVGGVLKGSKGMKLRAAQVEKLKKIHADKSKKKSLFDAYLEIEKIIPVPEEKPESK